MAYRWIDEVSEETSTVVSGLGAWVLLTAALSGATGEAAEELEMATGVSHARASRATNDLMDWCDSIGALSMAVGMWTGPDFRVRDAFKEALPAVTVGPMPDQPGLDRWAREKTDGIIEKFPLEVSSGIRVLLASAVVASGQWRVPFVEIGVGDAGGPCVLARRTPGVQDAAVLTVDGCDYSRVIVHSESFEVHLLAGDESGPRAAARAGFAALRGDATIRSGPDLGPGTRAGCLSVTVEEAVSDTPQLRLEVPAFDVDAYHDLLRSSGLFGLETASDCTRGHFDDISDEEPLCVEAAAQSARMRFHAEGFEAAAVTAIGQPTGAAPHVPERLHQRKVVTVAHDRTFAFLVVEPTSSLVAFAGWHIIDQTARRDTTVDEAERREPATEAAETDRTSVSLWDRVRDVVGRDRRGNGR